MTKTVNSVSVIFATDAGHGWLVLSRNEARAIMGYAFNRITPFSYQHENQVMLEEDQDAALFIQCCKRKGIKIEVREVNHGDSSVIRTLTPFRPDNAVAAEGTAVSDEPEAPAEVTPEAPAEVTPETPAEVTPEAPAEVTPKAPAPAAKDPRTPENKGTFMLPAALLWAAAQFASTDGVENISNISIIPEGKETITVAATDGRMLLFSRIKAINGIHADSVFSLPAKSLSKFVARAERVIMADGLLTHMDRCGAMVAGSRPFCGTSAMPAYEQLIPDRYGNKPEAPIAFNPNLMQVVCKVASKLDAAHLRFASNGPTNPIGVDFEAKLPCYTDPVLIHCIVMPIQIRD